MKKKIIMPIILLITVVLTICAITYNKTKKVAKEDYKTYNIYIMEDTLPTLFANMDMVHQKDVPSYVWYQRADTLDNEYLKTMFNSLYLSEYIGTGNYTNFQDKIKPEIQKYVNDALQVDNKSHFNIYVTAEYYWMEILAIEKLGIPEDQINVTMYSCGTVDYVFNQEITKADKYETFLHEKERFDKMLEDVRSGIYKDSDDTSYFNREDGNAKDSNYILLNSLRKNVIYYLQFPELITFEDPQIKAYMDNSNMRKIVVKEKFNGLTEEEKQDFFKCVKLDKKEFDEKYFNSENEKYLIITGTRPFYGKYNKDEFKNLIEQVYNKYKGEYKILFKPHPKAVPNEEQTKMLEEFNIDILPAQLPMEAITFVYDGIKLGGVASSLYMSVERGDTLFFFESNKDNLVEPLNVLYDDLFAGSELMVPQK